MSKRWSIAGLVAVVACGFVLGLGTYTFFYAEGVSYFSKDPRACLNCHVMKHQFDSWGASGHHHVANCNDCHLPAHGLGKWIAKARNGWNHSLAFTLENFEHPIRISPHNQKILEANCIRCHDSLVHDAILIPAGVRGEGQSCTHCHRYIGHMPVH